MARSQNADRTVSGGGIDPYVAQSMMQNKSLAENRLTTAMQEQGANRRAQASNQTQANIASMQNRGQTQRAQMNIEAQSQMNAAQIEAQDRRAAEAEKARREDQKFQQAQSQAAQQFQAEQAQLQRDYDKAMQNGEWERADKLHEELLDQIEADRVAQMHVAKMNTNATMSMFRMSQKVQEKKEKVVTAGLQASETAAQAKDMMSRTQKSTAEALASDPNIAATLKNLESGFSAGQDIRSAVQKQMTLAQVSFPLQDLDKDNILKLEQALADGKIAAEDIRGANGVLSGALDFLDEALKKAEDDGAKRRIRQERYDILTKQTALRNLQYSKRKIGEGNETIGTRVRSGLGEIGFGDQINDMKAEMGTDDMYQVLDSFVAGVNNPELVPIREGLRPGAAKILAGRNATMQSIFGTNSTGIGE